MPVALKPGSTREFVLKEERGLDRPTVFLLRNLTLSQREEALKTLGKAVQGSDDELELSFEAFATVARIGLAGWRDFPMHEGGDLQFEAEAWTTPGGNQMQAVKRELIDCLETRHITELANAIAAQNQLTETDRGNSQRSD